MDPVEQPEARLPVLRREEGTLVVGLPGATAPALGDLRWRLPELLRGVRTLVVDVSAVPRLSSATVAVLLLSERRCRARGVRMVVRGVPASHVLVTTGLPLEEDRSGPRGDT